MHIVHIITRLYKGGSEENTVLSCLHQARMGHDVTLIFGPDDVTLEPYRAFAEEVHFFPVSYLRHKINLKDDYRGFWELVSVLKKLKPDIVHTHASKAGILGRFAAKKAGIAKIVHGVHILPFNNTRLPTKMVYLAVEHLAALVTDLFIHVSAGTRAAYRKAGIGRTKPHEVVHSGMDIDKFTNAAPPENWREVLHLPAQAPKPKIILMLASMEPRKQHLSFLEGFASATTPGDDIRLVLAGEGPHKERVHQKIAALNLGDRVIDLGYFTAPEQLIALADIGVLASNREGLPRVVVQYLAGSCPCVVTNIEGIEEVVNDGQNGLIVRTLDAAEVARETVALLRDPTKLAALRKGAEQTDVRSWSFHAMSAALDRGYALLENLHQDEEPVQ